MSKTLGKIITAVITTCLILTVFIPNNFFDPKSTKYKQPLVVAEKNDSSFMRRTGVRVRDFVSYDCERILRLGGPADFVKNAPHPLYRIDGSWFVCFDGGLAPRNDHCNVLSFGINNDYSFDETMNQQYGCHVHSFDPFVENEFFKSKRKDSLTSVIQVNPKWTFYRYNSI